MPVNEYKKAVEEGRNLLRSKGLTFNVFKEKVALLHTHPEVIEESEWMTYYNDYCYTVKEYSFDSVEEFAREYFSEWHEPEHASEIIGWKDPKKLEAPELVDLLVLLEEEDNHIAIATYQRGLGWFVTDTNRKIDVEVTLYRKITDILPEQLKK